MRRSTHPPTQFRFYDLELQFHYRHLVCRLAFRSTNADSIDALGGDDVVYNGGSENDIVALGSGNDSINFSADADGAEIYGQGGNDSLGFTSSLNTSTVSGGGANDTIWISKGTAYKAYGDLVMTLSKSILISRVPLSMAAISVMPPPVTALTAFRSVVPHLLPSLPATVAMTPSISLARSLAVRVSSVVKATMKSALLPQSLLLT